MKRKILIITPWYPTPSHPVEGIFIKEQARALASEHAIYVMALVLTDWKEILSHIRKPGKPVKQDNFVLRLDKFHTLPGMRFFYGLYQQFYSQKLEKAFDEIISTWGIPDVIHAHIVLPAGAAALRVGKKHNIPVVLTEHTGPFSLHLRTKVCRQLTSQTLLGMDQVIAVSPALRGQITDFEPHVKVKTIGNVIDDNFFAPTSFAGESESVFRFLTIAILTEIKGIKYLLEAMRILSKETNQRFELVIGGDGPERKTLEQQVKNTGMMSYCKFTGALDRPQVRNWINQSDVFILPSLSETFGVVLLEAMMCGKPVIATRCGGPEDLVTPETGVLVDVADSNALAKAMSNFIKSEHQFNSQNVRDNALERYGQTAFLDKIAQLYDTL